MAAFQYTIQQVNIPSEELSVKSLSVDSLSSVVDPNVDFVSDNTSSIDEKDSQSMFYYYYYYYLASKGCRVSGTSRKSAHHI